MTGITENTTLVEFAALVSEALEDAGIIATLFGGAAVSIYTEKSIPVGRSGLRNHCSG
jgi:hypothetical protein